MGDKTGASKPAPPPLKPAWIWEVFSGGSAIAAPVIAAFVIAPDGGIQRWWVAGAVAATAVSWGIPRYNAFRAGRETLAAEATTEDRLRVARNGMSKRFTDLFSEFAEIVVRPRVSAGVDKFTKGLLNQLADLLDHESEISVRACYYTHAVMEEDASFQNDIAEVLELQDSSSATADSRPAFSSADPLGALILRRMREGQAMKVVDIGKRGSDIPDEVLNDPRYPRGVDRPYTGFYSVPVFNQHRDRDSRLVGMLTVDFDGEGRPTEDDVKLVASHKDILTTAIESAERVSRRAPQAVIRNRSSREGVRK